MYIYPRMSLRYIRHCHLWRTEYVENEEYVTKRKTLKNNSKNNKTDIIELNLTPFDMSVLFF